MGMKTMKGMKAKRVSKIAKGTRAKASVLAGRKEKTAGGLTKAMLFKNARGKIVSKKASAAGKNNYKKIASWVSACKTARKFLNLQGFVAINGRTPAGKALYAKAKSLYNA